MLKPKATKNFSIGSNHDLAQYQLIRNIDTLALLFSQLNELYRNGHTQYIWL